MNKEPQYSSQTKVGEPTNATISDSTILFDNEENTISNSEHSMHYELDAFAGPLDLLLLLVRQHKIDIYDIPIVQITDQYLEYLNMMLTYDLEDLTDFYKTAAWLLLIKSRTLLPIHTDIDDEIDTSRAELINTLIEYQKYKKLSDMLSTRYEQFNWLSLRQESNVLPLEVPQESIWKDIQAIELFSIFMKLMEKPHETHRIIDLNEPVTINEKMALIYEILETHSECKFEDIVAGGGVMSIVCALLAVLELMKQQEIRAMQHTINGEIIILRGSIYEETY